ncbi:MAG: MFS transporter [Actinobacteria bacterium]|nr:MFS transporter [Actinomycetota bacterium]
MAFALEAALFSTLAVLLPHYEAEFGMSTFGSGVLAACYTAGMVGATFLAGLWSIPRFGARSTALVGCVLLALASLAFGIAGSVVTLDAARTVQGVGAGLLWCSLLQWLIQTSPPGARGASLGAAFGAAVFGTAAGPLLGTASQAIGTTTVFVVVAIVVLAYAVLLARTPTPPAAPEDDAVPRLRLPADPQLRWIAALGLVPPVLIAAVITLVPLQLVARGASEAGVDVALLVGALLSAGCFAWAGRIADRRGHLAPLVFGLLVCVVTLLSMAVAGSPLGLAIAFVLFEGIGLSFYWVPLIGLFSERAEVAGMSAGAIALALNLTFTTASTVGPPLLTWIEQTSTEAAPYLVMAAATLLSLAAVGLRRGLASGPAPSGEPGRLGPAVDG